MSADAALDVVRNGIAAHVFPAAAAAAGSSAGSFLNEVLGTRTFDDDSGKVSHDIAFDLASLTKPIAKTSVVMGLVDRGLLELHAPVADFFPEWRGRDRERVSVEDLLEHASGLPARLLEPPPASAREFEHDICTMPLEYEPRTKSIYSDLDFILLGFLIERCGGFRLAVQFDDVRTRLSAADEVLTRPSQMLAFVPDTADPLRFAPTLPMDGDPRRGRLLAGEVHDTYAAALGGIAGHAGLFGTLDSVSAFARIVLRAARGDLSIPPPASPRLIARAVKKSAVAGSSRALGWDTMLPTSSCGTKMSPSAFGHVGFTGTSIWIDPPRDRYYVMLTNRVCAGGTLDQMREVRRSFHDALADV